MHAYTHNNIYVLGRPRLRQQMCFTLSLCVLALSLSLSRSPPFIRLTHSIPFDCKVFRRYIFYLSKFTFHLKSIIILKTETKDRRWVGMELRWRSGHTQAHTYTHIFSLQPFQSVNVEGEAFTHATHSQRFLMVLYSNIFKVGKFESWA